jgi:cob(I)alamin adenosyltransferase
MSISTKTGDKGETSLYYGQRVPKDDVRVEAYGTVDELNSAIGLARSLCGVDINRSRLLKIQQGLVLVMGELAVPQDRLEDYRKKYPLSDIEALQQWTDAEITAIEADLPPMKGWSMPGESQAGAALDIARTKCRRAERRVVSLHNDSRRDLAFLIILLNRLSDLFWLMERLEDEKNCKA